MRIVELMKYWSHIKRNKMHTLKMSVVQSKSRYNSRNRNYKYRFLTYLDITQLQRHRSYDMHILQKKAFNLHMAFSFSVHSFNSLDIPWGASIGRGWGSGVGGGCIVGVGILQKRAFSASYVGLLSGFFVHIIFDCIFLFHWIPHL